MKMKINEEVFNLERIEINFTEDRINARAYFPGKQYHKYHDVEIIKPMLEMFFNCEVIL